MLLSIILFYSCADDPNNKKYDWYRDKETNTLYENGREYSGKREGRFMDDCTIKEEYKNGKLNGESTIVWDSGKKSVIKYKDGVQTSKEHFYDAAGNEISEEEFHNIPSK